MITSVGLLIGTDCVNTVECWGFCGCCTVRHFTKTRSVYQYFVVLIKYVVLMLCVCWLKSRSANSDTISEKSEISKSRSKNSDTISENLEILKSLSENSKRPFRKTRKSRNHVRKTRTPFRKTRKSQNHVRKKFGHHFGKLGNLEITFGKLPRASGIEKIQERLIFKNRVQ